MAYLVFCTESGRELGSRRLDKPITIGRSPDCDVSLHDIQLSRHHCKLERTAEGWVITDLQSKNGTVIDGRAVTRHALRPGEVFKIGRVNVTFRAGKLAPEQEKKDQLARPKRPASPFNASEGTVAGFKYEPPAGERSVENFPTPKPVLTDSGRFVAEGAEAEDGEMSSAVDAPARKSATDSTIAVRAIPRSARPKAPTADLPTTAAAAADPADASRYAAAIVVPPPPRPPLGLRLRMLLRAVGRGLLRPLSRRAALLV